MLVSIFIPTYNAASVVRTTVESVLGQTYRELEVVVVDDASTDATADVMQDLAARDPRIHFHVKPHDGSVPFAWQYVWPHLSGDFTLYMSHDDLLASDCIERLVAVARADATVDAVVPTTRSFRDDFASPEPEFESQNRRGDVGGRPTVTGDEAFAAMLDYSIPGFALWRTDVIRREGMPTESFNSDEAMQRLWARRCRRVAFAGDAIFGYRQSAASIVKGLRAYHYASLYTQRRLLLAARDCPAVDRHRLQAYHEQSFRSLLYLKARYAAGRGGYDDAERRSIERAIADTTPTLRSGLRSGNVLLRLAASSTLALDCATWLYSLKFRTTQTSTP